MRVVAVLLCLAMVCVGCTRVIGGAVSAGGRGEPLYAKLPPEQGALAVRLLTADEIGKVTGISGLQLAAPVETVLSDRNIQSDCAFAATLATRQQYLSFAAARVQIATKVAGGIRQYTIADALVVFQSVSNAQQQFKQFASRIQRCNGVHGDLKTATGTESWQMQVIHAGDDEVNWVRKNDSGRWTCQMVARPRANYIASVMYCRPPDDDDKSEQVLAQLLNKLAR